MNQYKEFEVTFYNSEGDKYISYRFVTTEKDRLKAFDEAELFAKKVRTRLKPFEWYRIKFELEY